MAFPMILLFNSTHPGTPQLCSLPLLRILSWNSRVHCTKNPRTLPIMQTTTSCRQVLTILMPSKETLPSPLTLAFRLLRCGPKEIGISPKNLTLGEESHTRRRKSRKAGATWSGILGRDFSLDMSDHLGRREWSLDHYEPMMGRTTLTSTG